MLKLRSRYKPSRYTSFRYQSIATQPHTSAQPIFHPTHLIVNLTAGCICGVVLVIYAISFAALIFSGDLSGYVSTGIGIALFTAIISSVVIALMSSLPGIIADLQEAPTILFGLIASAIVARMPAGATSSEILYTVLIAIAFTSVLTGIFCFILGTFKLGELTRLIPYPVVGGFLAGTGWLLADGALRLMVDLPLSLAQFPQL
ncbi:MAG TPA: SulP family inorganic anion transporter, partial [Allocoleopsis sp.]